MGEYSQNCGVSFRRELLTEMLIYFIQFFIIFSLGIAFKEKRISKLFYHSVVFVSLVLIAGLRDPELGLNDFTHGYLWGWRLVQEAPFSTVFVDSGSIANSLKDPGFAVVLKLLSLVSTNEFFFQFAISIPYYLSLCWFISKYSKNPWLSYIVAATLHYFTLPYYLLRPMMALTFIFIATDALIQGKTIKSLLFAAISVTMHFSSILFFVVYLVKGIKTWKPFPLVIAIALFLGLFGKEIVFPFLNLFVGRSDRFAVYLSVESTGGLYRFLIALLFLVVALLRFKALKKRKADALFINMSMVSAVLMALCPLVSDFWRIALLFECSNCILFANTLELFSPKEKFVLTAASVTVFVLYIAFFLYPETNVSPYRFFSFN